MELCGKIVRTIDSKQPCIRPKGHLHGCNPFSNTCHVCEGAVYNGGCTEKQPTTTEEPKHG